MNSIAMKHISRTALLGVLFAWMLCSCEGPEEPTQPAEPEPAPYGYFYLGEEEIPVNSYATVEEGVFMLKLSPLDEPISATTYAIIGVSEEFLGKEIDVTTKYHNDDYLFVYEDPTRYHAGYRQLQSGTILLTNTPAAVTAKINIVLFDGTPFTYDFTISK